MTALPDWTTLSPDQKRDAIRPLWEADASAREISMHFVNASRNSIISALNRYGMVREKKISVHRATTKPRAPRVPRAPKPKPATKPPRPAAYIPYEEEPPSQSVMEMINGNRPPLAGTVPVSLVDLPSRKGVMCRWPVIGGYCGAACGDDMYCKDHATFAYRPAQKKDARR